MKTKQIGENQFKGRVIYENEHDYEDEFHSGFDQEEEQVEEEEEDGIKKRTGKKETKTLKGQIEDLYGASFDEEVELDKLNKDQKWQSVKEKRKPDETDAKSRYQDFYPKDKKKARLLSSTDQNCPLSETYAAFVKSNVGGSSFLMADLKIRKSDRMQYVAGTFYRGSTSYG